MNLKQLRYFLAVADSGGFSQAAETAHTAQSALSRHVRLLESELNTRLFNRTGRGVTLTEQGEYLRTHSRSILEQLSQVERSLQSWYDHPSGLVRLGMTPTAILDGAATLVRAIRSRHPEVRLSIFEELSAQLCRLVQDNQLDLALVLEDPGSDLLCMEKLRDEPLCLVAPPGSDLPERVPLERIESLTLILPTQRGRIRHAVERSCTASGVRCEPAFTVDAVPAIKSLVASGEGFTVLTRQSVAAEAKAGTLTIHELEGPGLVLPLFVTYRAKQMLGRASMATLQTIRELFSA